LTPEERKVQKEKCLQRVRLHRLKKKLTPKIKVPGTERQSYKTPQSFGRAFSKVKQALPSSPRKRRAVVTKLSQEFSPSSVKTENESNKMLPESTVKCINKYFLLDSVSRQSPGVRDYITVRSNGKKTKLQKRHLTCSLKEVYAMFKKENPTVIVSFSKFCSLRPPNVLLSGKIPRNVCLCQYHDNMKLLCDAIHKTVPVFPPYSSEVLNNFVCSVEDEDCVSGNCDECPRWFENLKSDVPLDEPIQWFQWERIPQVAHNQNKNGKECKMKMQMQKVVKEGTLKEALEALQKKLPSFLDHVFVKRKQSAFFEEKKSHLHHDEAVIQVDFAENYSCFHQDEVQAAHWNKNQVTIFPVVVWTSTSCESHVIVSNARNHDKRAVSVFLDIVLNDFVKGKHPEVKEVHIFSDGPSSQFKNKYMVQFIRHQAQKTNIHLQWNYFATSHGKGAVDGVGATIKRSVSSAVLTRKVSVVNDAKSFVEAATTACNLTTTVTLITEDHINEIYPQFHLECAPTVPGISKVHCVEPVSNGVSLKKFSYQDKGFVFLSSSSSDSCDSDQMSGDSSCESNEESDSEESNLSFPSQVHNSDEESGCAQISDEESGSAQISDEESSSAQISDEESGSAQISDEESGSAQISDEESQSFSTDHEVHIGLPDEVAQILSKEVMFSLPQHYSIIVDAILSYEVPFGGNPLISVQDLKELSGKGEKATDKWLTNFVIDEYLKIISTQSSSKVKALPWEKFARCSEESVARELEDGCGFENLDLILVPCNSSGSNHWFLVAVFPKLKIVVALDSLSSNHVKPLVKEAVEKCICVLSKLPIHIEYWKYFCSTDTDVLQQGNTYDCGVFVCLYARALAFGDPLVISNTMPDFRQLMIAELHKKQLLQIPPPGLQLELYYAVDYIDKFYIGRLISLENGMLKFKFLHSSQITGSIKFYWPRRDDIDTVNQYCCFYGPINLNGCGPFTVDNFKEVEKVFHFIKKLRA
jgi:hypothetical protein